MKGKSKVTIIILILVLILTVGSAIMFSINLKNKKDKTYLKDKAWLKDNIKLVVDDDGVYQVIKDSEISIFTEEYQEVMEDKIDEIKDLKDYTLESPLIIYNPYGTGVLSYYLYYDKESTEKLSYKIETEGYDYFEFTFQDEDVDEFQLMGFIIGEENSLTLMEGDNTKTITINTKKLESDDIDITLDTEEGSSTSSLTNGLYALLGHDKNYNANIYLYDNNGVLRNELVLESYRADRILSIDGYLYYPYKENGLMKVNRLGKIEELYELGKYEMHHDFVYDEEDNSILILASDTDEDTIEDLVIKLDLDTFKTEELLDFKTLLPEFYLNAVKPENGNSYGGDELDWIHINSIDIKEDELILSSRELSTIISVKDYNDKKEIEYLITDESNLENTSYLDLNYQKTNDFVSQAGQHSVSYYQSSNLEDGEYYLIMYNNNYGNTPTRKSFSWDNYPGVGTYLKGDASYFYQYLVNENDKTYTLVKSFAVPYSSIVSNVSIYQDNIITSSGMSHLFEEYDSTGNLIKKFTYTSKKFAYRAIKYDFESLL